MSLIARRLLSRPLPAADDPLATPIKLAAGVRLIGIARQADGQVAAVLHVRALGRSNTVVLPFEQALIKAQVERALARVGYLSAELSAAVDAIIRTLREPKKLPAVTIVDATGWQDDFRAYAFGANLLGRSANAIALNPALESSQRTMPAMSRSPGGSWRAWRDCLALAWKSSDALVTSTCFALASMMASPLQVESCLVHFHGQSTIGKTVLLIVARSIFGNCARELLPNWNSTAAGVEELLDTYVDTALVIDELTFLEGDSEASRNLKNISYAISSNRGRTRSRHWSGSSHAARSGRTIVLSTGELTLSDVATKQGLMRRLGQQCRAIDINVETDSEFGIFKAVPPGHNFRTFVREIETCCQANYGHPGHKFLRALISDADGWRERARHSMQAFLDLADVSGSRLHIRLAERFALAYAAGLEARRVGLMKPLSERQIARSLRTAFDQASRNLPDLQREVEDVLARLREEIRERSVCASSASESALERAYVLSRHDRTHGTILLVKPPFLDSLCSSQEVRQSVIHILRTRGHLITDRRGLATRQVSVAGNPRRTRFICLAGSFMQRRLRRPGHA